MLRNADFVEGNAGGTPPTDWNVTGQCGQENWAGESATNGVAYWGWNSGGGAFWQQGVVGDTNGLYYLRIRGLGEAQFASCNIEITLELYQSDDSTQVTVYTNVYPSSTANTWETYVVTGVALAGTARIRPVFTYPDRAPTGWGSQSYKWDHTMLYDRTLNYRTGEMVDEFSYDPDYDDSLNGKARGNGFTNSWIESNAGSFNGADGSFTDITGYPKVRGNKVMVHVTGNNATRTARREFPGITTGMVYFSSFINFTWGTEDDKWMGISIMSNSTELAFVGAKGVSNKTDYLNLVLDSFGGSTIEDDYEFQDDSGNDYIIIGRYNFATRELAAKAYWAGSTPDTVPTTEPATWDVSTTVTAGRIGYVNGICLGAGNNGSGDTCGDSYWDEVRVARSWEDLLLHVTYEWDASAYPDRDWSTAENWTGNEEPIAASNAYINGGYTGVITAAGERCNKLYIGSEDSGTGTLEQTGGDLIVGDDLILGVNQGADKGYYKITAGTLTVNDDTLIGDQGVGEMLVDGSGADVNFEDTLNIGDGGGGAEDSGSYLIVNDGTVTVDGQTYIGRLGQTDGTLYMSGGVFEVHSLFNVGENNDSTGRVYVTGGRITGLDSTDDFYIGDAGYGFMQISGGTVDVNGTSAYLYIGEEDNGGVGSELEISGGLLDVEADVRVGYYALASGLLDIQGGHLELGDDLSLAETASSTGRVTMSGGTVMIDNSFNVGYYGYGQCDMTGGSLTGGWINVGMWNGSTGLFTIADASLELSGKLTAGYQGTTVMNIDGAATADIGSTFYIAEQTTGHGTVNQTNGTVTIGADFYVAAGMVTYGEYNLLAGTLTVGDEFRLANELSSYGEFNLSGGTLTVSNQLYMAMGTTSTGRFNATGGTLDGHYGLNMNRDTTFLVDGADVTFSHVWVGQDSTADSLITICDGSLTTTGSTFGVGYRYASGLGTVNITESGELNVGDGGFAGFYVGYDGGHGVVNQSNGTVTVMGSSAYLSVASQDTASYGEYHISGGSLDVGTDIRMGYSGGAGTFHIIGDGATITVSNVFRIYSAASTLQVSFVSSQISTIEAGDDLTLYGALTIDDDGSLSPGTYVIATSLNNSAVSTRFATTNWNGVVTGDVLYDNYSVSLFIPTEQEISVRGTNGAEIADGDATPSAADGTDYLVVPVDATVFDNTFSITNIGEIDLAISSVTTSGTHAADFTILNWPSTVSGKTVSNLIIRFDPSATGARTATIHVNSDDADEADYDFVVQGEGVVVDVPTVTNYFVDVDNEVTDAQMINGNFNITMYLADTNGINTTNELTTHFIPSFSIWAPSGVQVLTDEVFNAFTHAADGKSIEAIDSSHDGVAADATVLGTHTNWYSAENSNDYTTIDRATDDDGTPITFNVVDDDPYPPQITSNANMRPMGVCLGTNWYTPAPDVDTTNAIFYINRDDLLAVSGTNPFMISISAYDSSNGLHRSASGSFTNTMNLDWGASFTNDIAHYASSDSTLTSTGVVTTSTWTWTSLTTFELLELTGSNAITVSLWDNDLDRGEVDRACSIDQLFGYIILTNGSASDDDITPPILSPVTYSDNLITNAGFESGYAGWALNNSGYLANLGDAARDGTNGIAQRQDNWSYMTQFYNRSLPLYSRIFSSVDYRRGGGATNARLRIYQSGNSKTIDSVLNTWQTTCYTNYSSSTNLYYFRLYAGSPYAPGSTVCWDNVSVRIPYGALRIWAGNSEIGNYYGTQTNNYYRISDGELAATAATNPLRFVIYAHDPESGLSRGTTDTNTQMHLSIVNWLTNDCTHYYAAGSSSYADSFSSGASSVWHFTSFSYDRISSMYSYGSMYITSSIPNADNDEGEADREWLRSQRLGQVRIVDDDSSSALYSYFSAPYRSYTLIFTNGSICDNNGATYGSTQWRPTDGALASISASQPFEIWTKWYDNDSGLHRTNVAVNPDDYCSITVPGLISSNITAYDASRSGSFELSLTGTSITNVWRWTTPFNGAVVESAFQTGLVSIGMYMVDADDDREGDYAAYFANLTAFELQDDDTDTPELSSFVVSGTPGISTVAVYEIVGGGWSITGLARDVTSGININGSVVTDATNNISPYFTVKNSTGTVVIGHTAFTAYPVDGAGQGATYVSLGSPSVAALVDAGEACEGIYTALVVCADNDGDRTTDHLLTTNVVTFEVVDMEKPITVDGNTNDWVGVWPEIVNASSFSSGEFIWRDKEYEERNDPIAPENMDIYQLRMAANVSNLYFMVSYQNLNNFAHPYIAIGVDTNQDPADAAHNWIGDDANTTMGDGYFMNGNAAMHYPDVQIIVHNIDGVGQRIELYDPDGNLSWDATSCYGGTQTTWSTANNVMEFMVPRKDLGLLGSVTGRFTVATFQNAQIWANSGDSTTNYATSDAIDSISIAGFGGNDSNLTFSSWDEDISDGDIDFFFDVRFNSDGLIGNAVPAIPLIDFPTNGAVVEKGTGQFQWQAASDSDDQVTSYLLEISTNATFNGGENGHIMVRYNVGNSNLSARVNEMSAAAATQFYWRVRSRDLSGMLSPISGPYMFQTTTDDDDTDAPMATLLYVGTNYTPGTAIKTELYDGELANTNNPIDIAIMLSDASGVFLTNHVPFASDNIVSGNGRVVPNWDILQSNTLSGAVVTHGHDVVFTNFSGYNASMVVTAYQYHALSITNIDLDNEYYLTVSAEDEDNNQGTTADPQGDGDPIPDDRAVRTNYMLSFNILDDDTDVPLVPLTLYTNRYLQDPGFELSNTVWRPCCQANNAAIRYGTNADSGDHYGFTAGNGSWYEQVTDTNYYVVSSTSEYALCVRAMTPTAALATNSIAQAYMYAFFYTNNAAMVYQHIETHITNIHFQLTNSYKSFIYVFRPLSEHMSVKIRFLTKYGNTIYWDNAALCLASDVDWNSYLQIGDTFVEGSLNSERQFYNVTDGQLAEVCDTNKMILHLKAYDPNSGIARNTDGLLSTQMCLSIGDWITDNVTNCVPGAGTADTKSEFSTNVWIWEDLPMADIQYLYTNSGGIHALNATIWDADNDRVDDQESSTYNYGSLKVEDDDFDPPGFLSTNMLPNPGFEQSTTYWWIRNTGSTSVQNDPAGAHSGDRYAFTINTSTFESMWDGITGESNKIYTLSAWVKASPDYTNTGAQPYMKMEFFGGPPYTNQIDIMEYLSTNWIKVSMTCTSAYETYEIRGVMGFCNRFSGETGTLYWDDVYLGESTDPFQVAIGTSNLIPYGVHGGFSDAIHTWTNELFEITDAQMAEISPADPLKIILGIRDDSAVSRGTTDVTTQMNASVEGILTNNVANYNATLSSDFEGTRSMRSSNVWSITSFSVDQISDLVFTTSKVSATIYDADHDRGYVDVMCDTNQQFGYISFMDDDEFPPVLMGEILEDPTMDNCTWTSTMYSACPYISHRMRYGGSHSVSEQAGNSTRMDVRALPMEISIDANFEGDPDDGYISFGIHCYDTNGTLIENRGRSVWPPTLVLSNWTTYTSRIIPPAGTVSVAFYVGHTAHAYSLWTDSYFDNASLRYIQPLIIRQGDEEIYLDVTNDMEVFTLMDGMLASASASDPFEIQLIGGDYYSGLQCSSVGSGSTQCHLTVGAWIQTNNSYYSQTYSSTNTTSVRASNVWAWSSMPGDDVQQLYLGGTNNLYVTLYDKDHDRHDDQLAVSNEYLGGIRVVDDDTVPPCFKSMEFGGVQLSDYQVNEPLRAGDILPIAWDKTPNDFSFLLMADIPEGTIIYIRDDEWDGVSSFINAARGTLSWTPPPGGAIAGMVVSLDCNANVSYGTAVVVDPSFSMLIGDQVWFYTAPGWNTGPFNMLCAFDVGGFSFGGNLTNTTLIEDETALAVSGYYHCMYTGRRNGGDALIRADILSLDNWFCGAYQITNNMSFMVLNYEPVDIAVVGWNSDGDDDLAFMTMRRILPETKLYFRDDQWDGTNAFDGTSEGTLEWIAPDAGVDAGEVVVIDGAGNASTGTVSEVDAGFDIANSSDQVWIYTAPAWNTPPFKMQFAIETASSTFGGDLTGSGLAAGTNAWAWGDDDNWRYDRSLVDGTHTELWAAVQNSANWESTDGSGDQSYTLSTADYTLLRARLDLTDADIGTFVLTGMVADVGSGVYGAAGANAPTITIYNASGNYVEGSYLSGVSDGDGCSTSAAATFTSSSLNITGAFDVAYTAVISFVDYDSDRTLSGVDVDSTHITELIAFTLRDDDTNQPNLFDFRFDGTLTPTDGQMANGLAITGLVQDLSGIYSTTNAIYQPVFSLFSPTGAVISASNMNDQAITPDGGATTDTSIGQDSTSVQVPYAARTLGTWTARVEVVDYDRDRAGDEETSVSNFVFDVIDDDAVSPAVSLVTHVYVGGVTRFDSGTGTNRVFKITEGDMANLATAPLEIHLKPFDVTSGLARNSVGASTNMNVSILDFTTNDVAHFSITNSSDLAETMNSSASSNVWQWNVSYGYTELGNLFGTTGWYSKILADVPDADDDRPDDITWLTNQQFGFLQLVDDDILSPTNYKLMDVFRVKNGDDFTDEQSGGTSTNRIFSITDGDLRALSTETQLWFSFYARDVDSGFARGTVGATTNMNFSVANFTTNNVANFDLSVSTPSTTNSSASNVWAFSTAFTYDEVTSIHGANGTTNPILATIHSDNDDDRANDYMPGYTNWQLGLLAIIDDDRSGPAARETISATFTNPALEVYLGGDYHIAGFNGTNVWQGRALNVGDAITNSDEQFVLTDQDLADLSADKPLMFKSWFWDANSGLMGVGDSATNKSISLGDVIVSNAANFSPTYSVKSVDIDGSSRMSFRSTNSWLWTNLTYEQIGMFHTNNAAHSNAVVIHSWDADMDRANDQAYSNLHMGTFVVLDEDTNAPIVGTEVHLNLLRNYSFEMAGSSSNHAYFWAWTEPDKFGGVWNNYLRKDWRSRSGNWLGTIPATWGPHASDSGGWWQAVTNDYAAGTTWRAAIWVWNDSTWSASSANLFIHFLDNASNVISSVTNIFTPPGENWSYVMVEGTSPVACTHAKFEIAAWGMNNLGALQFDDAELGPYVSQALSVQIGGSNVLVSSGAGTNAVFTVTDGDLALIAGDDLLDNGDFEDGWNSWSGWGAAAVTNWAAESGSQGGYFRGWPNGPPALTGGLYQDVAGPIAGDSYTFAIRGLKEVNFLATECHQKLEFADNLHTVFYAYTNVISLDNVAPEWRTYTLSGVAPGGASYVRATILFAGGSNDGAATSFKWDNATLTHGLNESESLIMRFSAYDEDGIRRGTSDPDQEMNITVDTWMNDNVANYASGLSSAVSSNSGVSVWSWNTMDKGTISSLYEGGTNIITANLFDTDDDRPYDGQENTNQQYGFLHVIDDDTNGPVAQQLDINWSQANATNFITDGEIRVGNYGIKITFEDESGIMSDHEKGWLPNFDLLAPGGITGLSSSVFESFNSLSNGAVTEVWKNWAGAVDFSNVVTGVWSVVWSAEDNDTDRRDDQMYTLKSPLFSVNTNIFTVYDDDTTVPIAPSNLVASITDWTNINNFGFTWDPAIDASGIPGNGYRTYTNATPLADDGVPMSGTSITNIITNDIYNAGFEMGDGESREVVYDDTFGWWSRGSLGSRGRWSNAQHQEGTNSMLVVCDAGTRTNGGGRYALIQSYVPVNNTNNYPGEVVLDAYFLGDLSTGANSDFCCAFLKMEYCDASSNVIAPTIGNEWDDGLNGRPGFGLNTAGTWSNLTLLGTNMPASTEYILATVGIGNNGSKLACSGYWDNVSIEVGILTPKGTFGASYTNAAEGSNTVWLYVVDDDQDRPGDQLMSAVTNFTIMYDGTAPDQVINFEEYDGPDETCEVELRWDACADAGGNDLSPWRSYRVYYTEEARDPTTNDSYFSSHSSSNRSAVMGSMTADTAVLSNFVFGLEYSFAIAGEDIAGNISALSTSITHYFAGFFMTQGVSHVAGGKVGWTAHDTGGGVVDRPYDVLYCDSRGFFASLSNRWHKMSTVTNSFLIDSSIDAIPDGQIRFYRAAQPGRWMSNRSPRIASAEVYGMKKLNLYPGQNWVQIPFVPDTDTVAFVFGTNLPGGSSGFDPESTYISWYERTDNKYATNEIWFARRYLSENSHQ